MGDKETFLSHIKISAESNRVLLIRLHLGYCPSQSPSQPGLVAPEMSRQAFYHLSMNKPWVPSLGIHTGRGHAPAQSTHVAMVHRPN